MNDLESLLMTIVLSDIKNAGTVKELLKDFNIYQKNRQSILIRVLVPKSLIGDQIMTQYFDTSGQMIVESGVYTALKMGMVRVDNKGKKTKTDSLYLRYIKEIKTEKGEFYIYERIFPSVFTLVAGTGINAPKIVFNLVNILNNIFVDNEDVIVDEPTIINLFTTQECRVDILPSTNLDQDLPSEPGEVEMIQGQIDSLKKDIYSKADKDKIIYKYDLKEELPSGVTFNKDGYKSPNIMFLNAEYDLPNMEYSTDKFVGSVLITNDRQEGKITKQIELFFYDTGVSQRIIELNQDLSVKSIGDWSTKVDRKQNLSHIGEFLYVDKNGNINFTKALKDLITKSQGELLTEDTSSYDFSSMFNVTAKNKEEIVIDGTDELKAVIKEIDYDLANGTFDFERYNGNRFTIQLPTKLSQFENDTDYITKDVNNLTNYTITDKVGNRLTFLVDPLTYVLTVNLLNPKGVVISTGQVDLPLESMVISASYEDGYITLTLQNGEITRFSIAALISGLVPTTRKINGKSLETDIEIFIPENLSDLIEDTAHRTVSDAEKTKWNNKVDKVSGKGLSTNDFTNAEKNKLAGIAAGAEANVQADWNEANILSKSFIKNKPNIPEGVQLYSEKGSNTDGAMTQKASTDTFAALKSNQIFTGSNTFTNEIIKSQLNGHSGFKIKNTGYTRGTTPISNIGLGRFITYDKDDQYMTYVQSQVTTAGAMQISLTSRQATEEGGTTWKTCSLNLYANKSFTWANISGQFQPASNNTYSLGEANFRWKTLYLSDKINTTFGTTSYLKANKGDVPLLIERPAGSFNMIANVKSTNGTYLFGAYQTAFRLYYTAKTTIDADENQTTKNWSFNEDGTMTTTAPATSDNSTKVPTTNWVTTKLNNYIENLPIKTITDLTTRIFGLEKGIYFLPGSNSPRGKIYYNGSTDTSKYIDVYRSAVLIIETTGDDNYFTILKDYEIIKGYTSSTSGSIDTKTIARLVENDAKQTLSNKTLDESTNYTGIPIELNRSTVPGGGNTEYLFKDAVGNRDGEDHGIYSRVPYTLNATKDISKSLLLLLGTITDPLEMGENGYIRLTNGLIIQWGVTSASNSNGYVDYITFPTAFASGDSYKVIPSVTSGTATSTGQYNYGWSTWRMRNTDFSIRYGNTTSGIKWNWIAIGY